MDLIKFNTIICTFLAYFLQFPAENAASSSTTTIKSTSVNPADSCLLVPALPDAVEVIAGEANSGKQLVKIRVTIRRNDSFADKRLNQWVISTSPTGQSMLMLKEYFDAMSVYTLGLGVGSYAVTLNQERKGCLNGKQIEEVENILRKRFLSSFGSSDHMLSSGAEICSKQMGQQRANIGRLVYVCCKYNQENKLQCSELTRSIWIQLLFISIIVLQVLIILYSPIYMPDFMYKAKSIFKTFTYTAEPDKLLEFRVKTINDSLNVDAGFTEAKLHEFTHMNKFKGYLENVTPGETQTFMIKGVDICVRDSKIVAEGDAPVGIITFMKDFFVRCKMRYDIESVRGCCMQDVWVKLPCKVVFRWYECLSGIIMLMFAVVLASPWIFRIGFYYFIEEKKIKDQKEIYKEHGYTIPYPGNLVTYLSPTHYLFNVIHILFAVEIFVYIIMPGAVKEKVKFTVRQCFRDTRDKSKLDACGKMASHMLRPLKHYGVVGCFLLPLWLVVLPFYCLVIALEVIPIANLSVRLLMNLIYYISKFINPNNFRNGHHQHTSGKCSTWLQNRFETIIVKNDNEANTRLNKLLHSLALIMTFVTVWLFLIIVVECIAFYVECAVYAMVGFIINPASILKYVSLILLIAVYGNECFSGVHGRYAAYSIGINSEIQGMVGEKMTEEASKPSEEQNNTAFRVPARNYVPERLCLVTGPEGFLKWKTSRLVMFLDNSDIPYISTAFLFQMGQLNHFQCPGLVHLLYLKAFLDFFLIVLFLIFVFIVIFAFGQAEDISTAGQTIAALGTGFFPLVLKKFLFQSQGYALDRSNLHWKNMFAHAVQMYSEKWNFEDITVAQPDEIEMIQATNVSTVDKSENNSIEMNNVSENRPNGTSEGEIFEAVSKNEDSIDLIVKRGKTDEGEEIMTFYVPYYESDNVLVDDESIL